MNKPLAFISMRSSRTPVIVRLPAVLITILVHFIVPTRQQLPVTVPTGQHAFTLYPGEKTMSVEECKTAGMQLLDTCLVDEKVTAPWQTAWDTCRNRGGRLLEIPNDTYELEYGRLSFVQSVDNRWMGFVRNTSSAPAVRYWYHGPEKTEVNWTSANLRTMPNDKYPLCGRILRDTLSTYWVEHGCAANNFQYFCQYLLSDVYGNATATVTVPGTVPATTQVYTRETIAVTVSESMQVKQDAVLAPRITEQSTTSTTRSQERNQGQSSQAFASVAATPIAAAEHPVTTTTPKLVEQIVVSSVTVPVLRPVDEDPLTTTVSSLTEQFITSLATTAIAPPEDHVTTTMSNFVDDRAAATTTTASDAATATTTSDATAATTTSDAATATTTSDAATTTTASDAATATTTSDAADTSDDADAVASSVSTTEDQVTTTMSNSGEDIVETTSETIPTVKSRGAEDAGVYCKHILQLYFCFNSAPAVYSPLVALVTCLAAAMIRW